MISIKDLQFEYADSSFSMNVKKLSFEKGESIAVRGPSGSGKSTFLSLLAGEIKADSGEISYEGCQYSKLSVNRLKKLRLKKFGVIFQQPRLIEWMSVKDNILLPVKLSGTQENTAEHLKDLTDELEITNLMNKDAGKLSLGEQMRVSIIRSLIKKPEIILADEPTASLDSKLQAKAIELLIRESKKTATTLILVSHDDLILKQMDRSLSSEAWELK